MVTMAKGPATVTHATIASKLGDLTVVAHGRTVVGLYFPGHWHRPDSSTFGLGRPSASRPFASRSASISPATGGSLRCRWPPAATSTRSASGHWFARSRTARPSPTETWLARWAAPQRLWTSALPSAGIRWASSSRVIASSARGEADRLRRWSDPQAIPPRPGSRGLGAGQQAVLRWHLTLLSPRASTWRDRQATVR